MKTNILFNTILAFRAIGRILGASRNEFVILQGEHGHLVNFREQAQFDTQG